MAKQLTQIAFDFGMPEEPVKAPAPPAQQPAPRKTQPVVILPAEEEPETVPVPDAVLHEPAAEVLHVEEEKPVYAAKPNTAIRKTAGKRGRRSLKDIATQADLVQIPDDETLFKKQYYSIGEVAGMFRENQSLIRYWETEFDILQPRKNRKGDRFFRPVDIKNLVLIYDLLRRRKFTIEGAKDFLKKNKKADEKFAMIQSLQQLKGFLLELKANL